MFKRIPIHYFWTVSLAIGLIGILINELLLIIVGLFSFLVVHRKRIFNQRVIKRNIGKVTTLKKEMLPDKNKEEKLKLKSNLICFQKSYYQKINFSINSSEFIDQNNLDINTKFKSNQISSALKYLLENDKLVEKYQREKVRIANIEAENALKKIYDLEIERFQIITEALYKSGKACRFLTEVAFRLFYLRSKLIIKKIKVTVRIDLIYIRVRKQINIRIKDKTKTSSSNNYERTSNTIKKIDYKSFKRQERLNKLEKEQYLMKSYYRKIQVGLEKLRQKKVI